MKKLLQNASLRRESLRVLLAMMTLSALSLVPSFFALTQGTWPFDEDAVSLFGPWREWTRDMLHAGVLPLWDPHLFAGMPFISNGQTSVFYPFNIVYWILPIRGAMVLDAFFHSVVLGAGGYALARALHRSQSASWICALCLILGGGVAAHLTAGHLTWHAARAFLPWLMWALILFLEKRQSKFIFAVAIFFALQLFAGYPPYVLWSACWCFVFWGAWTWASRVSLLSALRPFFSRRVLVPGVLLLLLSSAVVLPLRETSMQSTHGVGMPFEIAVSPSATLYGWVRLALPNFFGGNRYTQWSIEHYAHEEAAYIGLLPLGLALLAPLLWRWKNKITTAEMQDETRFDGRRFADALWLILPIAMILSLGHNTPFYRWLYEALPPLRLFRVSARWLEIWFFAACVLAAFGWDAAFEIESRRKKTLFAGIAIFAFLLFISATIIHFWPANSTLWMETAQWTKRSVRVSFEEHLQYAVYLKSMSLQSLVLAVSVLLGTSMVLVSYRSASPLAKQNWRNGLQVFIALDLLVVFWSSSRFIEDGWPKTPWPNGIENFYRSGDRWNTAFEGQVFNYGLNQGLPLGIDSLGGYDALTSEDSLTFSDTIENTRAWRTQYQATYLDPLLRAAAVTHVFASKKSPMLKMLPQHGAKLVAKFGGGEKEMQLWKLQSSWPRAFLSSQFVRAPREKQISILRVLAAGSTPGVVVNKTAFSDFQNLPSSKKPKLQWSRGHNFSAFRVDATRPQILVENEVLYPGWRAWVNKQPTKIERANFLFRGVQVPAGKSRVVFVYDTQAYRMGMFLTLLGIALMSGVLGFIVVRSRDALVKPKLKLHAEKL